MGLRARFENSDISPLSLSQPPATPEQIALLSPEFRALQETVIDHFEKRVAGLEAKLATAKAKLTAEKRPRAIGCAAERRTSARQAEAAAPAIRQEAGRPDGASQTRAHFGPPLEGCGGMRATQRTSKTRRPISGNRSVWTHPRLSNNAKQRLGLAGEGWMQRLRGFHGRFRRAAGTPTTRAQEADRRGRRWIQEIGASRAALATAPWPEQRGTVSNGAAWQEWNAIRSSSSPREAAWWRRRKSKPQG